MSASDLKIPETLMKKLISLDNRLTSKEAATQETIEANNSNSQPQILAWQRINSSSFAVVEPPKSAAIEHSLEATENVVGSKRSIVASETEKEYKAAKVERHESVSLIDGDSRDNNSLMELGTRCSFVTCVTH